MNAPYRLQHLVVADKVKHGGLCENQLELIFKLRMKVVVCVRNYDALFGIVIMRAFILFYQILS